MYSRVQINRQWNLKRNTDGKISDLFVTSAEIANQKNLCCLKCFYLEYSVCPHLELFLYKYIYVCVHAYTYIQPMSLWFELALMNYLTLNFCQFLHSTRSPAEIAIKDVWITDSIIYLFEIVLFVGFNRLLVLYIMYTSARSKRIVFLFCFHVFLN